MADADKPPALWERFRAWVFRRFGVPGLIVLAFASAAVFAWTQRDKVSNWPGLVEAAGAEYYVTLARNNLEGVRALLQVAKLPQPAPADKAMCETVEA